MKVRVTPIGEDGSWGTPIVHDDVTSVEHEQVDPEGQDNREVLVVHVGGDTHRYALDTHWADITRDEADTSPVLMGDEVPDDLGNSPDKVRAQYARDQSAADRSLAEQS